MWHFDYLLRSLGSKRNQATSVKASNCFQLCLWSCVSKRVPVFPVALIQTILKQYYCVRYYNAAVVACKMPSFWTTGSGWMPLRILMPCYPSKPDRPVFKWFNASVGCIIRASAAVLFLLPINHLHYCYVCTLEGGFSWFKHSWCLNWICLLPIRRLRNHFKALNHGLTVFMSADVHTQLSETEWAFKRVCVCVCVHDMHDYTI